MRYDQKAKKIVERKTTLAKHFATAAAAAS